MEIRDTYQFKKGKSRSKRKTDSAEDEVNDDKEEKRSKINARERRQEMDNLQKLMENIEDQIRIKQRRIQQGKGNSEFKLCDELAEKVRSLLREKHDLGKQLTALQKLELKSKWYHKKVKLSKNKATATSSTSDTASDTASDTSSPNSAKTDGTSSSIINFFKNATTPASHTSTSMPQPVSSIPADEDGHSSGGDTVILDEDGFPLGTPPLLMDKQESEEDN